ncbi:hypothetical protein [Massilia rubra]|uniref:Uncharacterized protein n=1 Tax=Massilia rubra TaxID=2607910 RepID=A0ABX0LMY0_9BURK|nr:hypothetical protein [Massilia rubra]NHZ32869.1 hypothetical protein [Massilia rubra]
MLYTTKIGIAWNACRAAPRRVRSVNRAQIASARNGQIDRSFRRGAGGRTAARPCGGSPRPFTEQKLEAQRAKTALGLKPNALETNYLVS